MKTYNFVMRWILVLMFVFTALPLSSCSTSNKDDGKELALGLLAPTLLDGQVYATQAGTNIWGLNKVLQGAPNTFIMMKDNLVLFAAPMAKDETGYTRWWFTVLNTQKFGMIVNLNQYIPYLGNGTNPSTFSDLVGFLQGKHGWQPATTKDLPAAFVTCLASSISYLVQVGGTNLTTFLAIPVYMLDSSVAIPELKPSDFH